MRGWQGGSLYDFIFCWGGQRLFLGGGELFILYEYGEFRMLLRGFNLIVVE